MSKIYSSIVAKDVDAVRHLLSEHGELLHESDWLHDAASLSTVEMVQFFLDAGLPLNARNLGKQTPLEAALSDGRADIVEFLLSRGADVTLGRTLQHAIHVDDPEQALMMVKALVEHGADVNQVFHWYDNPDLPAFTPLSWAEIKGHAKVIEYLRLKGARLPEPANAAPSRPKTHAEEIIEHLSQEYGPVQATSLQEIIPSGMPVSIHVIPATERHRQVTLFTIGLSEKPMPVPATDPRYSPEEYAYAELLMHLPPDWPLDKKSLATRDNSWPVTWLRKLARYPHEQNTWFGGPFAIIANEDPPRPIAPNSRFVALMLAAKSEVRCCDGRLVQLYTVLPLYPEEYELERTEDLPALLRALDSAEISDAVDLNRPNAVSDSWPTAASQSAVMDRRNSESSEAEKPADAKAPLSWGMLVPIFAVGGLLGGLIKREESHGRDGVFWLLVLAMCGFLFGIAAVRVWRYRIQYRLTHLIAFQGVLLAPILLAHFLGAYAVVWSTLGIMILLYGFVSPAAERRHNE